MIQAIAETVVHIQYPSDTYAGPFRGSGLGGVVYPACGDAKMPFSVGGRSHPSAGDGFEFRRFYADFTFLVRQ